MAGNILLSSIFLLLLPRFLASFEDLLEGGRRGGGGFLVFFKNFLEFPSSCYVQTLANAQQRIKHFLGNLR